MSRSATRTFVPPDLGRTARAIAIGASAGGLDVLLPMLCALPADYPLPVIVVLHISPERDSLLSELFTRRAAMRVMEAADKQRIEPSTLYFAPAGYHLLVEKEGSFALSCDPPEHYSRPSIDVLFESAADAYGEGLVGILLTGANDDGAAGMARIAAAGGLTVVQDPAQAQYGTMPLAALALCAPDYVLPQADISTLVARLARRP